MYLCEQCLYVCVLNGCLRYLVLRCARIGHIGAGVTETFNCRGMTGRYVNIVIPGKRQYLTLAEVEVYGLKLNQHQRSINSGGY